MYVFDTFVKYSWFSLCDLISDLLHLTGINVCFSVFDIQFSYSDLWYNLWLGSQVLGYLQFLSSHLSLLWLYWEDYHLNMNFKNEYISTKNVFGNLSGSDWICILLWLIFFTILSANIRVWNAFLYSIVFTFISETQFVVEVFHHLY